MIHADVKQAKEIAKLHVAIKHQCPNHQYVVLQTPTKYQGVTFKLLIDLGVTHSCISITYVRKLNLFVYTVSKFTVKLATYKLTQTSTFVGNLHFKFGEHQAKATFRILHLGIFDGNLGMDWLGQNSAIIIFTQA